MTIEFRLPDLGEDVSEGEVVSLLVKEGDFVEEEQGLLELETDKALLEVPSPARGRIVKIHTEPGTTLSVGDMIVTIEEAEPAEKESAPEAAEPSSEPEEKESAKVEPIVQVKPAEKAPEEETPPEPPRPSEPAEPAEVVEVTPEAAPKVTQEGLGGPAAPSTRRLARELGVDLDLVAGSGEGGKISQEDVKAFAKKTIGAEGAEIQSQPEAPARARVAPAALPDFTKWGEIERRPMSKIRKRTMQQMQRAWSEIPTVTQFDEANITDLVSLRGRHAKLAEEKGGKLTVTVFVLKAIVSALKEFPELNASVDVENEELIVKNYFHIGIAVDTEHGLIVPVMRDVDKKPLADLSAEVMTISERTRNRKLGLEDLRGATFTLTNLGGLGGTAFTPIINPPEVAILGLARTQQRLVKVGDEIQTRQMLPLCLSYDHRVIDGALALRFLRKVASMLEDPALLLLES